MIRNHSFRTVKANDIQESPYPTHCSSAGHLKGPPRRPAPTILGKLEPSVLGIVNNNVAM